MADILTNAEVNKRAVIEKASPVATPEGVLANQVRDVAARQSPDVALQRLQELKDRKSGRDIGQVIDQAIGTDIDLATGKKVRAGDVLTRFNDASAAAALAEKKYSLMTPGEKTIARNHIENILKSPDLEYMFDMLPLPARNAAIRAAALKFLEDPNFADYVQKALLEATDPSKLPAEINRDLQMEFAKARQELAHQQHAVQAIEDASNLIEGQLNTRFGLAPGSDGEKLRNLGAEKNAFEQEQEDANADRVKFSRERERQILLRRQAQQTTPPDTAGVASANAAIAAIDLKIIDADDKLSEAQDKARDFKRTGKSAELERLQGEKDKFTKKLEELESQMPAAEAALREATYKYSSANASLTSAQMHRAVQEATFVTGVQDVFKQAAIAYVVDEFQNADKTQRTLLEEAKAAVATNQNAEAARIGKAALDQLNRNWDSATKTKKWWGKEVYGTETTRVNGDMTTLLNSGPEALVRQYLIRIEPTLAGPPPDRLNALMANKELMDQLQPQLLESLLAKRLDSSSGMGKMSEADARRIASSDWGKELITKAIEKNKAMKAQVDAMRAQGAIPGNFAEWILKRPGLSLLAILTMLFSLGGAAIFGTLPIFAGVAGAEAGAALGGIGAKKGWDALKAAA